VPLPDIHGLRRPQATGHTRWHMKAGELRGERTPGVRGSASATRVLLGRALSSFLLAASIGFFGPADFGTALLQARIVAPAPAWAAPIPEMEYAKLSEVRELLQTGKYQAAEATLTRSLKLWQAAEQPAAEVAAILKDRSIARQESNPMGALADLDAALELYASMDDEERPAEEVAGATFLRAQVNQRLSNFEAAERDFSAALELDEENPFMWSARADSRLRGATSASANWAGAAQDYLQAEKQFKLIGTCRGANETDEC
jgi:tetratricopeptide (TPR) repeat protein